jgi:ABC-type nitrate/sulfonate/bicarbonate transport system substrate-binding protein
MSRITDQKKPCGVAGALWAVLAVVLAILPSCTCQGGGVTGSSSPSDSGIADARSTVDASSPVIAPERVRYAVSPFQDTLLPIVPRELGWYKEVGLDVDIKILGWTEVQEAIAGGAVDVGINNISSIVATHEHAPNLVYAYGMNTFDNGFALMVRPKGPFRTVAQFEAELHDHAEAVKATARQLKGRTVVTTSNTDMEQGVAAACKRGAIAFDTVKIVNLPPDEGLAAFLAGTGDAYIGGIPQRTRAGKEGMVEMLSGVDIGPAPINGIVTTKDYFNGHIGTLEKLVRLWFRTVQYINAREGDAGRTGAEIVVRELNRNSGANFTLDDFWRFWNKFEHYPANAAEVEADIMSESGKNYWKRRWDDCNDYFFTVAKRIKAPVDPAGVFLMPTLQARLLEAPLP